MASNGRYQMPEFEFARQGFSTMVETMQDQLFTSNGKGSEDPCGSQYQCRTGLDKLRAKIVAVSSRDSGKNFPLLPLATGGNRVDSHSLVRALCNVAIWPKGFVISLVEARSVASASGNNA